MNRYKTVFWGLLGITTLLWLMADTLIPTPLTYFSFRHVFTQYSGVLGIMVMSTAMILATRPVWLESWIGGMDKIYRLHKWLGIGALVITALHWWMAKGTKWMVGWGWLDRPERGPRNEQALPALQEWLNSQRGLAEGIGEWAFYAVVIFIALALIKRFPYRLFRKTHLWISVAYLLLVLHSSVLMNYDYWSQPVGWLTLVMMIAGSWSAVLVLSGRTGQKRKFDGTITGLNRYQNTLEGQITLDQETRKWPGHTPGQFAFVTSDPTEGAHPYTIASSWNPANAQLTFMVKELGDWTAQLKQQLRTGMPVKIEGPYGCFDFADNKEQQIWIAAGIGITPFIARMEYLIQHKLQERQIIDLFFSMEQPDADVIRKVSHLSRQADVNLHLIISSQQGRLAPEQVRDQVPGWREASLWFCGPKKFGQIIRSDFHQHGIHHSAIHQELFEMR